MKSFILELPEMNTKMMNIFLQEFKKHKNDKDIILVMDNASPHKSKSLNIPEGIEILYLPPYSPQLNPVERVFQEIRKYFKNMLVDSLPHLKIKLSKILVSLLLTG